jgi:hypothetical protein
MLRPKYVYVIRLYNGDRVRVEAEEITDNPSRRVERDICWAEYMLRIREITYRANNREKARKCYALSAFHNLLSPTCLLQSHC